MIKSMFKKNYYKRLIINLVMGKSPEIKNRYRYERYG